MIETISPAPAIDLLALYAPSFKPSASLAVAALQVGRAETFGFVEDGRLLAAIGFWPEPPASEEVFLVGLPAAEIGSRMLELYRLARLTVEGRRDYGVVRLTACVREGHRPGERLARLVGFSRAATGAPAGFTRWERRFG